MHHALLHASDGLDAGLATHTVAKIGVQDKLLQDFHYRFVKRCALRFGRQQSYDVADTAFCERASFSLQSVEGSMCGTNIDRRTGHVVVQQDCLIHLLAHKQLVISREPTQ